MDYVLTEHARKRCIRRKIKQEWIAAALACPARTENDVEDQTVAHALLAIPEKSFRVLRVVYNETIDPVSVVTAYFDDEVIDL